MSSRIAYLEDTLDKLCLDLADKHREYIALFEENMALVRLLEVAKEKIVGQEKEIRKLKDDLELEQLLRDQYAEEIAESKGYKAGMQERRKKVGVLPPANGEKDRRLSM